MNRLTTIRCQCGEELFELSEDEDGYKERVGQVTDPVQCSACGATYRVLNDPSGTREESRMELIRIR